MPFNQFLRDRTQAVASSLTSHRILLYTIVSTLATCAAVANALKNYSNFYSIAIFLSKSSRSVVILANFAFLVALLCGHIVQKIFFGTLRPNEVERLYDRLWFFITESLLAFTIFRDEFDLAFAVMFGFLLFVKSFHWLAGDRIEWMDQRPYPGPPLLFHIRMTALFFILWTTDLLMFVFAVESTITNGVGGMVLFASEYGILMATMINTISKYLLSAYDLRMAGQRGGENAPPWEDKSMWVFYIELSTDFVKLTTYLIFFTIILTFYGLPLNIIRDVWTTARSFISRLRALHRYQNATRNMDQRYPNATEEEMTSMSDRTCIICREEMVLQVPPAEGAIPVEGPNTTPKKLPCGHIFHFHCLRSWLERQQSCPTCRRTVLDVNPTAPPGVAAAPGGGPAQPPGANPFGQIGAHHQNPQGMNNPLGNPLGLVGRFFGPQAQPPIAPGQFVLPQNANGPPNAGNAVGPPAAVVIQYHIQYQPVRQQPQQGQQAVIAQAPQLPQQAQPAQPAQPLQPAPQFQGFPGPGGVWQPWPANARNDAPPNTPTATVPSAAVPTPTQERTNPIPASAAPDSTPGPSGSPAPREAAALAALRRLNSERSQGSSSQAIPSHVKTPSTESTTSATSDVPTSTTNSSTPSASPQRLDIPKLIPLYDFGSAGAGLAPNQTNAVPQSSSLRPAAPSRSATQTPLQQGTPGAMPQSFNFRTPVNPSDPRISQLASSSAPRAPISQLPPTLTNEQLAIMDRVTREAIDERLRVLEGVSGAVYRCIDDLLRMRSSLPASNPSVNPRPSTETPVAGVESTSAPTGTGQASVPSPIVPEVVVVTSEAVSSGSNASTDVPSLPEQIATAVDEGSN